MDYKDVKKEIVDKFTNRYNVRDGCIPERCISSFRKIQLCFGMVEEKYDLYIRSRMDIMYETPIDLKNIDLNSINIPLPTNKTTRLIDGYYYSYTQDYYDHWIMDHIAIGPYNAMKIYCNVYDSLDNFCIDRGMVLHSEYLTKQNLVINNIPINRIFAEYSLHRKYF